MKISICYDNKTDFGNRDIEYIKMLESDPSFEKLIIKARKRCGTVKPLKNYKTSNLLQQADKEAQQIIDLYDLPESWLFSLSFFIVTDKFYPPGIGIYYDGLTKEYSSTGKWKIPSLTITITQKMGWYKFLDWIEKNKKDITSHLKELPLKRNPPKKYFELRCKVYELHGKGLKPNQIEEELKKDKYDYLIGIEEADYCNIRKWVHRFNKVLHGKPVNK